jgi:hypothetical protein
MPKFKQKSTAEVSPNLINYGERENKGLSKLPQKLITLKLINERACEDCCCGSSAPNQSERTLPNNKSQPRSTCFRRRARLLVAKVCVPNPRKLWSGSACRAVYRVAIKLANFINQRRADAAAAACIKLAHAEGRKSFM